jgi:hypothetical protein
VLGEHWGQSCVGVFLEGRTPGEAGIGWEEPPRFTAQLDLPFTIGSGVERAHTQEERFRRWLTRDELDDNPPGVRLPMKVGWGQVYVIHYKG